MKPVAYFFLFLVTILGFFGPGFQDVALLVFLHPMLMLVYFRWTYKRELSTSVAFIDRALLPILSLVISGSVALAGVFNDPDWKLDNVLGLVVIQLLLGIGLGVFCYLAAARFQDRFECSQWFHSITFAMFYTAAYFILRIGSPIGNFASPALSLRNYPDLVQIISILGVDVLVFLIGWTAGVGADWLTAWFIESVDPNDDDSTAEEVRNKTLDSLWPRFRSSIIAWLIVMCLVVTYGGVMTHDIPDTFYQRSVDKYMPQSIPAACVIAQKQTSTIELFDLTAQQADAGRELIMWSEAAVEVISKEMQEELQSNASATAQSYGVYLGITYQSTFRSYDRNMFELYGPDGDRLLSHQKHYPVPGVEDNVKAGKSALQTAETKWGKVGAGICFDLDFPDYILTAGQKDVKLLLQPSWTWGPIAEYHFFDNGYRAVENGLTLFRCGSVGYSGVVDAQYRVHAMIPSDEHVSAFPMQIPLQDRRFTVFPAYGFLFGWIVLGLAGVFWLIVVCPTIGLLYLNDHLPKALNFVQLFPLREHASEAVHEFNEEEEGALTFNDNPHFETYGAAVDASSPPATTTAAPPPPPHDVEGDPAADDDYYDRDSDCEDGRGSFVYVRPSHG